MSGHLKRRSDWDSRLLDVIATNRERPYRFGEWDCLLWPASAVEAVTGVDLARGHRGKYRSLASAYRHLNKMGFESPEALLDHHFAAKLVGFAGRGDLTLVHTETGNNPGVVTGDVALIVGDDGFLRAPRSLWMKAWAVGEHFSGIGDE